MNTWLSRLAAVLAFVIGMMAVFAGGRVLLGTLPDYYVIAWLPVYNFAVGVITAFVTAILIWRHSRRALSLAIATFGAHALVMLTLFLAYADVVAPDSLRAMTVRLAVWAVILALLYAAGRLTGGRVASA